MASAPLPHWDLSDLYPSLDSREYAAAREAFGADVVRLEALFDEHDVRGGERTRCQRRPPSPRSRRHSTATNEILNELRRVNAYISSFVTTDARDDEAQAELSGCRRTSRVSASCAHASTPSSPASTPSSSSHASTVAADHAFPLDRAALRASHQMTEAEEALASDLRLTGVVGLVPHVQRHHRPHHGARRPARHRREGTADGPGARAGQGRRPRDPQGRLRRRARRLGDSGRCRSPPRSTRSRARRPRSTRRRGYANALETGARAATTSSPRRSPRCSAAVVASFPDFRRYMDAKADAARRRRAPRLLRPVRARRHGRGRDRSTGTARPTAVHAAFGGYSAALAGAGQAGAATTSGSTPRFATARAAARSA